jgi:hypothetical protein
MADIVRNLARLAERINAEHVAVLTAARTCLEHARQAGELLAEAKTACGHGRWLPWLKANVEFSERTAQAYMRVAKHWPELEAKAQATADLTIDEALDVLANDGHGRERSEGNDEPRSHSWFVPDEELDPLTRRRYGLLRVLMSDEAWDRNSWDDFERYLRLLDEYLRLLRGEDFAAHKRRYPFSAFDASPTNCEHADGGFVSLATLDDAVAWVKARGDCGRVHQSGLGTVYTGKKYPPAAG